MKTNYIFKARWLQGVASAIGSPTKRVNPRITLIRFACALLVLLTFGIGNAWGDTKQFTPTNFNGQGSSSGGNISHTIDPITVSSSKGYGYSTGQTRIFSGGTLVVSCTSGYSISGVALTFTSSNYQGGLTTSYTGLSTTSWTSPTLTGTARISKIVVTYAAAASCTTNPTVTAGSNSSVTATTATVSCSSGISSLGSAGCSISSYGFVIGTSSNPAIGGSGVTKHEVGTSYTTTGTSFSKDLTGLSATTTYYVRPYATNGNGTAYGTQTSFTTPAMPKYTVTLKDDNSTYTQASVGASVTLPSRTGCTGYTFAGWTKSWDAEQSSWTATAPTIIEAGSYTPTANENLYPVYTKSEGSGTADITIVPGTYTNKGSGNYGSGAERTGTVSTINFGGHYITGNPTNQPVNPCSAGTYIQCQASNANIYNKSAIPGSITKVVVNQYAAQNIDLYCGTSQLMASDETGTGKTPSGTLQTSQSAATAMTWNVSGSYTYFDLKKGSGTSYITSIVITYSLATTYYISVPDCCTELGAITGTVSCTSGTTATLSWSAVTGAESYKVKVPGSSSHNDWTTATSGVSVTGLTAGQNYTAYFKPFDSNGSHCTEGPESTTAFTTPKITASVAAITGLNYVADDGPSDAKSFTVSAVGMSGNVTVSAPTNFEVSKTSSTSGFGSSVSLTPTSGTISTTTIYVRLAADKSEGNYGPSNVTLSGNYASTVNVAVSGTVSPACLAPTITAHPTGGVTYRVNVTATALSVTATKNGTGPDLTYQWYSNTSNNNTTGTIIAGATSRTYTPPTSTPGTKYYYCEVSSGACMTPSNCAAITVSTPTITVSETSRAFGNKAKDSSSTMTFTVSGSYLGANIGLAISGTNAAMFSIDKTSLTHSSGTVSTQTITVTYNPTAVGSHTAQINITSTGATTKTVSLSGTGAWTVDWYVGGTDSENKLTSGSQSTLATNGSNVSGLTYPTSSQTTIDCGDKTFVGWTNTSSYTHGTSPLFTKATATGTITGNVAYYAVFAESEVDEAELTNTEITSTYVAAGKEGATTSYGDRSITSASGTWSGKFIVNINSDEYYVGIRKNAENDYIGSPTFSGIINNITIIARHNAGSARNIYICSSNATAQPTSGDIGSGSIAAGPGSSVYTEWTEVSITPSGSHTSFYVYADGGLQIQSISVTYGAYSEHDINCTTCNNVTVSYSTPSHATLSVKKSAAVISSGTQVSTCKSNTLTVKVTPDAANHYWMTAMSISGVTGVTTDPSTTSGLPTKEQKSYSVTIPKDATGTLTITPTIEAIPQKTISFLVNGDDAEDNSPQDVYVGEKPELPTVPDDNELSCAEAFVGWSTNELTETGNAEPADLFFTSTATPTVTDDVTYHAVFASKDGSKSGKYTLDYSVETSLVSSMTSAYGNAIEYTATDGSEWTVKAYKNSGMQINTGKDCSIKIPDCPSGATITTIEITGSTSKAVGISASDYSGSGTITYIATGTDATSQTLDLRGLKVTGGYIVPKSGSIAITKIVVNYAKYKDYMTYCTKIFTDADGADHNWSTAGNWSGGVPTIKDRARIQKPVTVDMEVPTAAKAKNVVIYNDGSTHTGQLIIDAGKELVVAETVRKTIDGSNYTATGEDDIVFNSTSGAGLGALVMGTHDGTNNATVNFSTLSNGSTESESAASASDAQYVGTPFGNKPAMLYQFYNSWMYKFINTGVPGWVRVNGEDGLEAFKGYCIFSADGTNHVYWMQGTLVASEDQIINLQYNGGTASDAKNENMLANSWMAPIKIAAFEASDFTNADATIYIYNTGSPDDYEKNGKGTGTLSGQYQVYTPGTAGTAIIPSMQAFSVYTSGSSPKITLDYSKLVYDPAAAGSVAPGPNKAPRRADAGELETMRLYIGAESGYGDMLYMLEREDFAEGFENGWDGRKMFGEDVAPQLYAVTPDGNMAINCIPTFEGQLLGFRKGTQDNFYTFTFEYEGENTWYLNDLKEQTSTLISAESTYMFMASAEDMAARFVISRTPIHYMPTGTEQSAISDQQSVVKKIVIDDKVFIIRNGQMYHVTGVMVR